MTYYSKATLPDGSRVTLYERGNDGPNVCTYEVVDVHVEGTSGLVHVGTMVSRVRGSIRFFLS